MDCREFRDKHAQFVDLMCSALEENELRAHVNGCPACSRHDTIVRRSLMLVKSLPTIEPSADFRARLDARLQSLGPIVPQRRSLVASYAAFAALAAGIGCVAFLAADALRRAQPTELRLAPVVASIPEFEPSPVATTALVATVPTGMSIWPALVVATQAPIRFVAAEMSTER